MRRISVAEPRGVKIENTGNQLMSKSLKVTLTLDEQTLEAEMKDDGYGPWAIWDRWQLHEKLRIAVSRFA